MENDLLVKYYSRTSRIPSSVEFVAGENELFESLKVRDNETNEESLISAEGVFIFIGLIPNTKSFVGLVDLDERGLLKPGD